MKLAAKKPPRTFRDMLTFLMPTLEQANDVKRWATARIRKLRAKRRRAE